MSLAATENEPSRARQGPLSIGQGRDFCNGGIDLEEYLLVRPRPGSPQDLGLVLQLTEKLSDPKPVLRRDGVGVLLAVLLERAHL